MKTNPNPVKVISEATDTATSAIASKLMESLDTALKEKLKMKMEQIAKEDTSYATDSDSEETLNKMMEELAKDEELDSLHENEEENPEEEEEPMEPSSEENLPEDDTLPEEENLDISEEELEQMIMDVIEDMIESGELEAGEAYTPSEETPEESAEEPNEEPNAEMETPEQEPEENKSLQENAEESTEESESAMMEVLNMVKVLQAQLAEATLQNAKLQASNQILKEHNLSNVQKVKILARFEEASTPGEAKLLAENLSLKLKGNSTSLTGTRPNRKQLQEVMNNLNVRTGSKSILTESKVKTPEVQHNTGWNFERAMKIAGIEE